MYFESNYNNVNDASESDTDTVTDNIQTNIVKKKIKNSNVEILNDLDNICSDLSNTMINVSNIEEKIYESIDLNKKTNNENNDVNTQLKNISNDIKEIKNALYSSKQFNNTILLNTVDFNKICDIINFNINQESIKITRYSQNFIHIKFSNYNLCNQFITLVKKFNNRANVYNMIYYYNELNNYNHVNNRNNRY